MLPNGLYCKDSLWREINNLGFVHDAKFALAQLFFEDKVSLSVALVLYIFEVFEIGYDGLTIL